MKKALVVDGNSLFYRLYYATAKQVEYAIANNYTPNNAIKLMVNAILNYINDDSYEYYFIAFDDKEKTFRHESFSSYKENRQKAPDELYNQMNDTITCLKSLGVNVMQKPKVEADDLVGSFAKLMNDADIYVDVISSDKDLLQLVNQKCSVKLIKKGISELDEYNWENFSDKFHGLKPLQIIEYKAIVGDSSDRLPGVNGIGPKTGISLLQKYHLLDNIYQNINELSDSVKKKFIEHKDTAYHCKLLATILVDQLNECQPKDFYLKQMDVNKLKPIVSKYHLKQLDEYINSNVQETLFDKE